MSKTGALYQPLIPDALEKRRGEACPTCSYRLTCNDYCAHCGWYAVVAPTHTFITPPVPTCDCLQDEMCQACKTRNRLAYEEGIRRQAAALGFHSHSERDAELLRLQQENQELRERVTRLEARLAQAERVTLLHTPMGARR